MFPLKHLARNLLPIVTQASIHLTVKDLTTTKSHEVLKLRDWVFNDLITLKFDRHLSRAAANVPVKFQSDWKSLNLNLVALSLHKRSCSKTSVHLVDRGSGPWFNITMSSYPYRKSHCADKTILRPSYLHNGISYTGKTASLYWIGVLVFKWIAVTW